MVQFETVERAQVELCLKSLNEGVTITLSVLIGGHIKELRGVVSAIEKLAGIEPSGWRITLAKT